MRFFALVTLVFVFSSCLSPPDCLVTATNSVKVKFKKKVVTTTGTISKTTYKDTTLTFLYIRVSGTDSLFYKGESKAEVDLPVRPDVNESTFYFYQAGKTDTTGLHYNKINLIISPECGSYVYYKDLTLTGYSYGTALIVNPALATTATANLEIRF